MAELLAGAEMDELQVAVAITAPRGSRSPRRSLVMELFQAAARVSPAKTLEGGFRRERTIDASI